MELKHIPQELFESIYDNLSKINIRSKKSSQNKISNYFPKEYSKNQKMEFLQNMYIFYFENLDSKKCHSIGRMIEEVESD